MKEFACPHCQHKVTSVFVTESGKILGCEGCMDMGEAGYYERNRELYELTYDDYMEFIGEPVEEDDDVFEHESEAYWDKWNFEETLAIERAHGII